MPVTIVARRNKEITDMGPVSGLMGRLACCQDAGGHLPAITRSGLRPPYPITVAGAVPVLPGCVRIQGSPSSRLSRPYSFQRTQPGTRCWNSLYRTRILHAKQGKIPAAQHACYSPFEL